MDHLRYGFNLMNRWVQGENPFGSADWKASWQKTTVSDAEWDQRRRELVDETARWRDAVAAPRDATETELTGMISSVVHLAHHFGAIRQIQPLLRGPVA